MYNSFYGLTDRPFQLTPDPRFYFDSATHRKAMAYLGYGLAQGEGFIVITGEIGAGKTTLVGHLMATVDAARLTCARITSTQVEGDDLLRMTARGFGIDADDGDKAALLHRIETFLLEQANAGKRSLLIVDEAQNLPISALEELRMLSNLQARGAALVQIFLLGQPEFRERLNGLEQLRQRVIATHHLDAMQADEVAPYIEHRLAMVGWAGNPRFSPDAIDAIHRASGGIPRQINALASRAMLLGAIERRGEIDGAVLDQVIAEVERDEAGPQPMPEVLAEMTRTAAQARPETAPASEPSIDRIAALEARLDEQEAVLRRVLGLLVEWVEADEQRPALVRDTAA